MANKWRDDQNDDGMEMAVTTDIDRFSTLLGSLYKRMSTPSATKYRSFHRILNRLRFSTQP
jgi:hypothetical protein